MEEPLNLIEQIKDLPDQVQLIQDAIEAILFAAGYPVRFSDLSRVIGLSESDVRNVVEQMKSKYHPGKTGSGLQLLTYPDTAQLCTKEDFAPYIREALGIRRGGNLSAGSMETLAVVAYNQPVTRAFIDAVRGVDSSYAVSSLLDKGLIESCGRLEAPGRPMLFATTDKFLRVFGLASLEDLPATEALSTAAKLSDAISAQANVSLTQEGASQDGEKSGDAPDAEKAEADFTL